MTFTVNLSSVRPVINKSAVSVGADNIFTIRKARFSLPNHGLVSEGANTCLLVAFNASKNNCLLHLAPEQQALNGLAEGLQKCINKLQERCGKMQDNIKAFLLGGKEFIQNNTESNISFNLYNKTADILEEAGIPFTMICGKKGKMPTDNIYAMNGRVTIWNDAYKDLEIPQNPSQDETAEILEKQYQFVELHPDVPVKFI